MILSRDKIAIRGDRLNLVSLSLLLALLTSFCMPQSGSAIHNIASASVDVESLTGHAEDDSDPSPKLLSDSLITSVTENQGLAGRETLANRRYRVFSLRLIRAPPRSLVDVV